MGGSEPDDDEPRPPRCAAVLRDGTPCKFVARQGDFCGVHRLAGEECAVCLHALAHDKRKLACGHCFHRTCLREWVRRGTLTCPLCRAPCPEQASLAARTLLGRVVLLGRMSLGRLRMLLGHLPWVPDRQHVVTLSYQAFTLENFYEHLRRLTPPAAARSAAAPTPPGAGTARPQPPAGPATALFS